MALRHPVDKTEIAPGLWWGKLGGRVASKGASIFKVMDVSRHKSVDTLRGYVRDG